MALLDRLPGELNLYIGGLFTLRRKEALQASGITHVLSVLRLPLDQALFEGFQHKVVEVDDIDDENLLEHFPACNEFIQDGLTSGGGVLVHCAMGKSRSATIVCAYLMQHYTLTPSQALSQLREARPLCEPNDGFMTQLQLYHRMGTPTNLDENPVYQRWLYQREIELSRACGQAPEADKIRFEDEHVSSSSSSAERAEQGFELRCRKCRRTLATSQYISRDSHPTTSTTTSISATTPISALPSSPSSPSSPPTATKSNCAHYFLDPLSWMRPELEQGKLDGRLECPKCHTNVGKYAWQGMRCSCGEWVVPGISLAKGRIDEVKSRTAGGGGGAADGGGGGIRMPPGVGGGNRSGSGGRENL